MQTRCIWQYWGPVQSKFGICSQFMRLYVKKHGFSSFPFRKATKKARSKRTWFGEHLVPWTGCSCPYETPKIANIQANEANIAGWVDDWMQKCNSAYIGGLRNAGHLPFDPNCQPSLQQRPTNSQLRCCGTLSQWCSTPRKSLNLESLRNGRVRSEYAYPTWSDSHTVNDYSCESWYNHYQWKSIAAVATILTIWGDSWRAW